ncbi:MAG TPA: tetratricopeptide repeat protein [Gammaproteobacteria bacterium]|nr:tetratricopeptide repeat protein [Gammaproteobacteria bacterium]
MSGPAKVFKWPAFAGLLVLAGLPATALCATQQDFEAGISAAQRQDHAAALQFFESAERSGMRKPLLYYNLGVSYYRLGRLEEAEGAFLEALSSPKLAALCYYNLGLIARNRGQPEQAADRFSQARAAAQTEQMRKLSTLALLQIADEAAAAVNAPAWFVWAEGAFGHDSNAALATDFETRTGGGDKAWNISAYGYYDFTYLRLHGMADVERYSELTDFNFDMLETGVSLPLEKDDWELRPGLNVRHMQVGNEALQDSTALLLDGRVQAGDLGLKFYLERESITGAAGYEYLEGTRNYFRANVATPDDRWQLIWDIELNERADFSFESGDFYSFSPQRREWRLEYLNPLTDSMDLKAAAAVQNSEYNDADIRVDESGNITAAMRRKDERTRLILELSYRHEDNWRSSLELMLTDRNSNFDEFDYERRVFTLNIGRSFGE